MGTAVKTAQPPLEAPARSPGAARSPVAYLVSRFPRLTETFILREILELERRGQPVIVFPLLSVQQSIRHTETGTLARQVRYAAYLSGEVLLANLHYLRRAPRRYLRTLWRVVWGNRSSAHLWLRGLALFPKSVHIARQIAGSGARHVHAHFATQPALAALVVSELTGIGYSFTAHAHDIFVHKAMLREKVEAARFVVTISQYNKQLLLQIAPGTAEEKIHVIRCGVDPDEYAHNGAHREPSAEKTLRILCVASLEAYKGIQYLVRACARLRESFPDFRLEIIGDGPQRRRLLQMIQHLELEQHVYLLGPRRQDEVAQRLGETDLFVLPSVLSRNGQMDGIPVALMEAMASGLPVIASALSGIPELVEPGGHGLLVPPADEESLARAMALLCRRAELREQMGRRGRKKVAAEFRLSENVARLQELIRQAASPTHPASGNGDAQIPPEQIAHIRQLAARGAAVDGADDPPIRMWPLRPADGHDSAVCGVCVQGIRQEFVLKQHRPRQVLHRAEACALREHEVLTRLAEELPRFSPRFRVPKPVVFFPESNALLLERCPGQSFEGRLRWAALRQGDRGSAELLGEAAACGEWLAVFHDATGHCGDARPIFRESEEAFARDLDVCARLGLEDKTVRRASERFAAHCQAVRMNGREITGHHGDFAPYNVFLAPDCVTVIDFEGFRPGLPGEDLADFLVQVDLLPSRHVRPALRRSLRAAFLEGYTRRRPVQEESLAAFELLAAVKRMAHNPGLARGTGLRALWAQQRLLRSYRRYVEALLS